MADHLGSFNTSVSRTHVRFQFTTHAATGAAVAPSTALENSDIRIYKALDSAAFSNVQRASSNGITMTSPFDTVVGLHDVDIDLTDNSDASFYVAGSYAVVLVPDETVDSQVIVAVLAYFDIGPPPVNVTQWLGTAAATPTVAGVPEVDVTHWLGTSVPAPVVAGTPAVEIKTWKGVAPADLVATFVQAQVSGMAADIVTAAALNADAVTEIAAPILAVLGALADAAADGAVTATDTVVAYLKQLINTLEGGPGIPTWPAGVAPGNAVSIAEGLRYLSDQVGLAGAGLTAADDAVITAIGTVQTAVDAIKTTTDKFVFTIANQVNANMLRIEGTDATDVLNALDDAVLAVLGAAGIGLTAIPWNAAWDTEVESEVTDALNAILTDSIPADGTLPTVRQALYMLVQFMLERTVAGTTVTVKKSDGSSTLFTLTLDDATSPSSITRAT